MKVKVKEVPAKKAKKQRNENGAYSDARAQFLKLEPMLLADMPDQVLITDPAFRPYISVAAKESGCRYSTFSVGNGKIAVFKYKVGKKLSAV